MAKDKLPKEDKSVRVHQRSKIKGELNIREYQWTPKQIELINLILDKGTKMVVISGNAGTSKTLVSVFCALKLMTEKKISDIIYVRSLVQSKDGETGFLSGTLQEKTAYVDVPFFQKLEELLPRNQVNQLLNEDRVKTMPTSMIRGYQFSVSMAIVDEAQNMLFSSLNTLATRMGEHSKLIIMADKDQNDFGKGSGFEEFREIFNDQESRDNGIFTFDFGPEDVMRSGLCKFVVTKILKYKAVKESNAKALKSADWAPKKKE